MVAVKSLWVLLKSFSNNFSFKRDSGVRVPDHKPDKRIRYNRLRPQWHRPYYPSADPEIGRGNGSTAGSSSSASFNSSKSYQDYLNGNGGDDAENKFGGRGGSGDHAPYNKDFESFINSDSDYEDGDSDGEDFDDDFTTTDEDEDSDLDDDDDDGEEVLTCEVCDRAFPTIKKLADHQEKKRHYGCSHCDSIFPSRKALDFHREQTEHFDYVSDYGTDDTGSFCSGSVAADGNKSSSSSSGRGSVQGAGVEVCEGKCCSGSGRCVGGGASVTTATSATTTTTTTTGGNNARYCSGRRNTNNNNYHCYSNQLHASWYEGDDEEEKGLLRN